MLRLLSLFSGIGAFEKALERLNIEYELVGFSEIDKFAIKSYCAIHNVSEDKNLGDITKIDTKDLPDFDIMTWGFPCQDISIAGRMEGIKKGITRSGLYYEGYRILKDKLPKYSVIENVKNLTSKRFKNEFNSILQDLSDLGYTNYWQVLNSKDYGIPQNRERVFIISIRNDLAQTNFSFPPKVPLVWKLKDVLEENVDEKYYLSEKAIGRLIKKENKIIKKGKNPDVSSCIIAGYYKMGAMFNQYIIDNKNEPYVLVREATKQGFTPAKKGDSINVSYPNSLTKRGRVGKEISQTILTSPNIATLEDAPKLICINNVNCHPSQQNRVYDSEGIYPTIASSNFRPKIAERKMFNPYNNKAITDIAPAQTTSCGCTTSSSAILISEDGTQYLRIRKLTPLECWRLMGFDDEDFNAAKSVGISDTQLYKQAGNSIVVNVLEYILEELLSDELYNQEYYLKCA